MGDNKEFDDSARFWCVLLIVGGEKLLNIEDSSLVILGYQLLPLANSKLMGDNKEFDDWAIFWCVLPIVGGKLQNFEDSSLVILGYQLLPLATSKLIGDSEEFCNSAIFWCILLISGGEKLLYTSHQSEILHSLIFSRTNGARLKDSDGQQIGEMIKRS